MKKWDAIVMGAGVAGLGAASALAEAGKKVLVISKALRGAASQASAGILDPFLEMNPRHPLFPLGLTAFKKYPSFLKRIHSRRSFLKTGMLYVAMTAGEERELKKRYAWQRKTRIPVRWLSQNAILKSNSEVHPKVLSGLFYPSIGRVQPRLLMKDWMRYAKRQGVQFLSASRSISLVTSSSKVLGVRSGHQFYEAPWVIQATGAWAGSTPNLGGRLPVLPARGQILRVRGKLCLETILHTLNGGYVVPWGKDRYIVGSNVEFCGFSPGVTSRGLHDILQRNRKILPGLKRCQVVDSWAGLRPYSQKGLPVIGPSRVKGLYLAAGYYRSGILISAEAGKLLAKGMISGRMPAILKPFHPSRFGL